MGSVARIATTGIRLTPKKGATVKAIILDTKTGKTAETNGPRSWEWAENNYSCDCNRQIIFGIYEHDGICKGGKRFIVIHAEFDDPADYEYSLSELNSDYAPELLREYGITVS